MHHTEGIFRGHGGVRLYMQCWEPETSHARVAIVHGIREHSGRYPALVDGLVARGFSVCGYDQRGHGRSPGQRGHIMRYAEYLDDLHCFLVEIKRDYDKPILVYAHSMGALIALRYIIGKPVTLNGVVLSGTPIAPLGLAKPHLVALSHVLSFLWPNFVVRVNIPASWLSRDESVQRGYLDDSLVHKDVTVRWGTENLVAITDVKRHPERIHTPVLFIHGASDRLSDVGGVRNFFGKLTFTDKELIVYPECRHEPHNDLCRDRVIGDVADWLERHLGLAYE